MRHPMTLGRLRELIIEALLIEADVPSAEEAIEVVKQFPKGVARLGVNAADADGWKAIGVGTHGVAFDIGGGKVFKVTNDAKEASAASVLVGANVPSVVRFFGVGQFGDTGLYGITQEKVEPLSGDEAKAYNDAIVATGVPVWIKNAGDDWGEVKKAVRTYILRNVKKKFPDNYNSPEAQKYVQVVNSHWNNLITRFKIRDMFNTLHELGIGFHDYHAGNLMKREDGSYVLIDLGISKIKGGGGELQKLVDVDF